MAERLQAGHLRERVTFSSATVADDGYGNAESGWTSQFTAAARIMALRGGESVMADRLTGKQPYIMTVRYTDQSRQITTDWRAVDANDGRIFNVRSASYDEHRQWIDLLVETGVAA